MSLYRMYSLDEFGRISFGQDYEAATDEQAVELVPEIKPNARQWEVWEQRRLVAESVREEPVSPALKSA